MHTVRKILAYLFLVPAAVLVAVFLYLVALVTPEEWLEPREEWLHPRTKTRAR